MLNKIRKFGNTSPKPRSDQELHSAVPLAHTRARTHTHWQDRSICKYNHLRFTRDAQTHDGYTEDAAVTPDFALYLLMTYCYTPVRDIKAKTPHAFGNKDQRPSAITVTSAATSGDWPAGQHLESFGARLRY